MVMFTKDGLGRYVTLGARVQHYNAGEIIQGRSLNGADFGVVSLPQQYSILISRSLNLKKRKKREKGMTV